MQPVKPTKKASGTRRARMYIRRYLGWMEGYPINRTTWQALPPGEDAYEIALDRDLLRRSTRAINKLLREFHHALPRLVGDTGRWAETRRALLEMLKPVVHDGKALPREPLTVHPFAAKALGERFACVRETAPSMRGPATALEWMGWPESDPPGKIADWIEINSKSLERLAEASGETAISLIVRLRQLSAAHGDKRVRPLIDAMGDPGLWRAPLEADRAYLLQSSGALVDSGHEPPAAPTAKLPSLLRDWIFWLSSQDRKTQRRGLDLFDALFQPDWIGEWANWWDRYAKALARAQRLPQPPKKKHPAMRKRRNARDRLLKLAAETPPAVPASPLTALLHALPLAEYEDLYRIVLATIRRWPDTLDGAAARLALAHHWFTLHCYFGVEARPTLSRLIPTVSQYLHKRKLDPAALRPWAQIWSGFQNGGRRIDTIDDEILFWLKSRKQLQNFFAILGAQTESPARLEARLLVRLTSLLEPDRVAQAFSSLRSTPIAESYLPDGPARFAAGVTARHPDKFAAVLQPLIGAEERYDDIDKALRPVFACFEAQGMTGTLLDAIMRGELRTLIHSAFKTGIIQAVSMDIPLPSYVAAAQTPSWPENYPGPLHPALRTLSEADDNARQTARKILGKDFPEKEAICEEIEALESLESLTEFQQKRLANLRRRLDGDEAVSPSRLANLGAKLEAAAHRAILAKWRDAVDAKFEDALQHYLGTAETPAWLDDENVSRALLPIAALDSGFQKLAKTLLARRCLQQPWDLRDDEANRAFLRRMRARGLTLEPWLDGARETSVTASDGSRLILYIERDPLEIFRMGGYFNTCLSPGASNYFSVFANAADINKQVMFARNEVGQVFGRMLMALTDEGGLLTFHPYARSRSAGFEKIARDFAHRLAEDMGAMVVSSGEVSRLVARDWYDDGPFDLTRRHPALDEDSPIRAAIPGIEPDRFVEALRDAFQPLPLNDLTLPLVLSLPELQSRPELAICLLPLVRGHGVPEYAIVQLTWLLTEAGAATEARQSAEWLFEEALRSRNDWYFISGETFETLIGLTPALALKLVRQTRPKGVRRWADEQDGLRLMYAAAASERLHRRKKAAELYKLAIKVGLHPGALTRCRQALAALEDR